MVVDLLEGNAMMDSMALMVFLLLLFSAGFAVYSLSKVKGALRVLPVVCLISVFFVFLCFFVVFSVLFCSLRCFPRAA
jgi:hypothetical protein